MDHLDAVGVPCNLVLGEVEMTIEKLSELEVGQQILLDVFTDDVLELVIGERMIAKGILMKKDGKNLFIMRGDLHE